MRVVLNMDQKYRLKWNVALQRWIMTSEVLRHGKSKFKKILVLTALMGAPYISYADCYAGNKAYANQGSTCEFSNGDYYGTNLSRIEGENTTAIFTADKVKMISPSYSSNHTLAIGGGNGGPQVEGGTTIFNGDLEIITGNKVSRGIYMYNKGTLLIKGDLTITKKTPTGAPLEVVKDNNVVTVNGVATFNTDGADAIRNGGNITFNNDLIINNSQVSGIGISLGNKDGNEKYSGNLTLNKNTTITTAGKGIHLWYGTLTNNGIITLNSNNDVSIVHAAVMGDDTTTFNNNGTLRADPASTSIEHMFIHEGTGTFIVNNSNNGDLSFDKGSLFKNITPGTININNAGKLSGTMDANVGIINLDNSGQWYINGDSNLNNVINSGLISFAHKSPSEFHIMDVKGDYVGKKGIVKMRTVWGATDNESDKNIQSDTIKIAGSAKGHTVVVPVSNDGKENIIDGDIKSITKAINTTPVIYVAESNNEKAFSGTAKTNGVVEFQLAKRTTESGDEYFWTMAANSKSGKDAQNAKFDKLIYANPVSGYTLMPRVNLEQGYSSIASFRERRGDITCYDCSEINGNHSWGRFFGKHHKQDGKQRLNLDTNIYGLQIGHDFFVKQTDSQDVMMLGAYFAYSNANTDFSDKYHAKDGVITHDKKTGNGKSESFSFGLTNTYYTQGGSYLDLVGQLSYLTNKYHAKNSHNPDSQHGWAAAVSAEVGHAISVFDKNWSIEPQAQLIYQYINLSHFKDGIRHVDQNGQDGLRSRLGLKLSYHDDNQFSQRKSFYVIGNLWHDFVNPEKTNIGRNHINEKFARTWGEMGIGMQLPIVTNMNLYSDVRYEHNFGSTHRQGLSGNVGMMIRW